MRFLHAVVMALAIAVSGCGGGAGGSVKPEPPSPPPTKTCPDGTVLPADEQCPATPQGRGPLPGIDRIPRSEIRVSNREMQAMYTVWENTVAHFAPDGHGERVGRVACDAYINGCDGVEPFDKSASDKDVGPPEEGICYSCDTQELLDEWYTRLMRPDLRPTTKILSASTGGFDIMFGAAPLLNYVVIQAAGNSPDEQGRINRGIDNWVHWRESAAEHQNARALNGNWALVVAGYDIRDGQYVRHESSASCEGVDTHCLYAPFEFRTSHGDWIAGTSFSTPQVSAALASVLAVYPTTEPTQLVKLAKACAVAEPGLDGLGRADFTCMTVMDDRGEWRVVGVDDVLSPMAMQKLRFPGQASLSGTFENANGGDVTLGLSTLGLFRFTPGVPVITEDSVTGFFPVMAGDERNPTLGVGYATDGGWFSRLSYGQRDTFFGLGETYGYAGSTAIDADAGHRNLFARMSWQSARESRLIHGAEGIAFGVGAQQNIYRWGKLGVGVSASVSKFLSGSADTAFGKVAIGESRWNREVGIRARYGSSATSRIEVGTEYRQLGSADEIGVTANYKLSF